MQFTIHIMLYEYEHNNIVRGVRSCSIHNSYTEQQRRSLTNETIHKMLNSVILPFCLRWKQTSN